MFSSTRDECFLYKFILPLTVYIYFSSACKEINLPTQQPEQQSHHLQEILQTDQRFCLYDAWNQAWVGIHSFHCIQTFPGLTAWADLRSGSSGTPSDSQHSRTPTNQENKIKFEQFSWNLGIYYWFLWQRNKYTSWVQNCDPVQL